MDYQNRTTNRFVAVAAGLASLLGSGCGDSELYNQDLTDKAEVTITRSSESAITSGTFFHGSRIEVELSNGAFSYDSGVIYHLNDAGEISNVYVIDHGEKSEVQKQTPAWTAAIERFAGLRGSIESRQVNVINRLPQQ